MTDPRKAHCPRCDGERICEVHAHVHKPWSEEDGAGNSMSGAADHYLLECRGCETVFYENESWDDLEVDHWYDAMGEPKVGYTKHRSTYPKPDSKSKPRWIDSLYNIDMQLYNIINEMFVAYDNQSFILTAIGLRTALDRSTEILGIDPATTFKGKLDKLQSGGWIGVTEREILEVVTDAGNAAAHRGWAPSQTEMGHLLLAMQLFLERAFIVDKKALDVRANIPPRPAKRAEAKRDP